MTNFIIKHMVEVKVLGGEVSGNLLNTFRSVIEKYAGKYFTLLDGWHIKWKYFGACCEDKKIFPPEFRQFEWPLLHAFHLPYAIINTVVGQLQLHPTWEFTAEIFCHNSLGYSCQRTAFRHDKALSTFNQK